MNRRPAFAIAMVILLGGCHRGLPRTDKVDDFVRAEMTRQHIAGLSIAVVSDGAIVRAKGYGVANLEQGAAASDSTVYGIASVTKQFTASAIMVLARDHRLVLDDTIATYLRDLPAPWRPVTVRHLLTQTSGIANTDLDRIAREAHSREDLIRTIRPVELQFTPGTRFQYSNSNYILLADIIRTASGESYETFLTDRLFRPVGMSSTRIWTSAEIIPHRAGQYHWVDNRWKNSVSSFPAEWQMGAGALLSTVGDLAKWEIALEHEVPLDRAALAQMWTRTRLSDGTRTGYGFGWYVGEVNGHRMISHTGDSFGISSAFTRFPDDSLAVIVLANEELSNTGFISTRVAGLYRPAILPADAR